MIGILRTGVDVLLVAAIQTTRWAIEARYLHGLNNKRRNCVEIPGNRRNRSFHMTTDVFWRIHYVLRGYAHRQKRKYIQSGPVTVFLYYRCCHICIVCGRPLLLCGSAWLYHTHEESHLTAVSSSCVWLTGIIRHIFILFCGFCWPCVLLMQLLTLLFWFRMYWLNLLSSVTRVEPFCHGSYRINALSVVVWLIGNVDQRSCSTSGPVSTGMGDRSLSWYLTKPPRLRV